MVHPWETGCDDSPRWDHYCPGSGFDLDVWRRHKIDLLPSLEFGPTGGPLANPVRRRLGEFQRLTVWNARELASVTGDDELLADVDALVPLIEDRWDADLATWVDAGPGARRRAGSARPTRCVPCSWSTTRTNGLQRSPRSPTRPITAARLGPRRSPDRADVRPVVLLAGPVWPQLAYLLWRPLIADRPRRRSGRNCGDERSPERCAQGSPSTGTAIRPPEAGRPRSPGPDSHSCWRRPARPRLVVGVEAAHLRTQLDDRARGFLRLVPPEGLKTRKRVSGTDGRRRRARRLARTSAIPTRMMRSPNDTTCLANDSGIVSPNEAIEVPASLNS